MDGVQWPVMDENSCRGRRKNGGQCMCSRTEVNGGRDGQ